LSFSGYNWKQRSLVVYSLRVQSGVGFSKYNTGLGIGHCDCLPQMAFRLQELL